MGFSWHATFWHWPRVPLLPPPLVGSFSRILSDTRNIAIITNCQVENRFFPRLPIISSWKGTTTRGVTLFMHNK